MNYIIRIALIALITLFSVNSFSQGNLQFNRARMESFVKNYIVRNSIQYDTIVVPAGKVLKITSTSCVTQFRNRTDPNLYYSNDNAHVYIENLRLIHGGVNNTNYYPIWLSEGNHILRIVGGSTSDIHAIFSFSGIEFNVIP
jgi:hypothetical protein